MIKSLASSKQDYVNVQIRKADTCLLHLQGAGISVNRPYGVAGNIKVTPSFASWIDSIPTSNGSLAHSGRQYINVQAAIRGSVIHFQIKSSSPFDGPGNRGYGAVLDIPTNAFYDLAEFVDVNQGSSYEVDNDDECDCCHSCCE